MRYVSTRDTSKTFEFKDVFIKGLADDGGLFIPEKLTKYTENEVKDFKKLSYSELAKKIVYPFIGNFMSQAELSKIIDKSYSTFRRDNVVDFIKLGDRTVLELFHGPTLAFKDVAMQLLGNFYEYYLNNENQKINIVVATSGDTGAAAIDAIKGKKNVNIFVLHPDNRVSPVQRKLMTTGKDENVFNIAIKGNFDDCQNLVKSMFADKKFSNDIKMSGVNSINWARIIAQSVYYFYSYSSVEDVSEPTNFSVPTGNFGDVYAGYLAKKMGLPINKLIVCSNKNDILSRFFDSGEMKKKKVVKSLSPSMDIQVSSNFERLLFDIVGQDDKRVSSLMNELSSTGLFKLNQEEIKIIQKDFRAVKINDLDTLSIIKDFYLNSEFIIDPHTATAIGAAKKLSNISNIVVLATAHPYKFLETVKKATGKEIDTPPQFSNMVDKKEKFDIVKGNTLEIKNYILKKVI